MKFTLSWLKEFLDTDAGISRLSEALTDIGLEVEEIQDKSAELSSFTVAEILSAKKHPDADKLQICEVLTIAGPRTIVCGAPNARAGIKVALADIGATIPNGGFKIKKSKIRGVESSGMMCSARELGLGDEDAGIMELAETATVGESIVSVLGLDDVLIEIAITPNRGDCLGVYGIARDLAAAGIGVLKAPDFSNVAGTGKANRSINIQTESCKHFVGRSISNIKNGESPAWLKDRLKSVGLRPISTLVDITNYITMTYGRPLHVYDEDKLSGDICVRDAKDDGELDALNDKTYTIPNGLCVIADDTQALGLGGVVGGVNSGCTEATTNVFVESAWFDPIAIATTGRALQVDSDARYRFERTVDPKFTQTGAELATKMIVELCGTDATTVSEIEVAGHAEDLTREIAFSHEDVAALGGLEISAAECKTILNNLGFTINGADGNWKVTNPSYRPDMQQTADLVEEVLRVKRYTSIPELALPPITKTTAVNLDESRARIVRRTLADRGMHGTYHFAFVNQTMAEHFTPASDNAAKYVEVINPISSELSVMRPNLLPNLLTALSKNIARDTKDLALSEYGNVFFGVTPQEQPTIVAGVRTGLSTQAHWATHPAPVDAFSAKADLFALLKKMGVDTARAKVTADAPAWYHPGKSGRVSLGGKITLGYFGEIHPATLRLADIQQDVAAFELHIDNIPGKRKKAERVAIKTSDFQATKRDFAFVVDHAAPAGDLLLSIRNADKKLLKDVTLFDVYDGKGIAEGKKSLALTVTLQAADRTLTEEDITRVSDAIIAAAAKQGAKLR